MFKNLGAYTRWVLSQPLSSLSLDAVQLFVVDGEFDGAKAGHVSGVRVHRQGQFQAELFSVIGPGRFLPHRHPNVDSVEILLGGDIRFNVDGRRYDLRADAVRGAKVRVRANQPHGAEIAACGAVFLSVQRWTDGHLPTSVTLNWDGPAHRVAP